MNRGARKNQSHNSAAFSSKNVKNQSSYYRPKNSESEAISSDPKNVCYKPSTEDSSCVGNLGSGDVAPACATSDQATTSGSSELVESKDVNGNDTFFDIFKTGNVFQLKTPLHLKNRVMRNENKLNTQGPNITVLRPGMLHLKHYISLADQVSIIKKCRNLGLSPSGFYEPANHGGIGTVSRKMMILGKIWDTENSKYVDQSPVDGTKPHSIPGEFSKFAYQAIRDSHDYLRKQSVSNIEKTLPHLNPDICVVNFYSKSGRLGLHRDKNESEESQRRGLPVVSISIGDSAEFVYGDQGDIDKAEKVVLESGDMLIFGGSSRLIYHGVTTIYAETAPKLLLEETNLRPGRLNLTFRQY